MADEKNKTEPALYIVPTPIGNLEDITLRALKALREADAIACEDTRRSGQLLSALEIKPKKLIAYHDYNEAERSAGLVNMILRGASVALISDAGTPSISDPGYRLVAAAIEAGVKVIPLPGATAAITALSASGLPVHSFTFLGFAPAKKGRKTFLSQLIAKTETTILYESVHKVATLFAELEAAGLGARQAVCARELTKLHEEFIRGSVAEINKELSARSSLKGEFVILIAGADAKPGKNKTWGAEND
ncbi:MAG: 16S rRNA (cytidine(1402)-2'-O)-methyltransferase [Chloroflexota bacterium]